MLKGIEGVSTYAKDVDSAFIIVSVITLFLFIATIGSMFYFVFKYGASKHTPEKTRNIKHYTPIEIAWTVIPTVLMMIVFYFGLESLRVQRTLPKDDNALVIKVLAQRWSWQFEYPNGKKSNELSVPVNQNIKLKMTAPPNDVLHSFYVPAFRAKEDILPGKTTYVWFNATKIGKYDIQCAEYCGTRHSYMRSFVNVLAKDDFDSFLKPPSTEQSVDAMQLFTQYGCTGCHSFDGTVIVGPSLNDIYNKEVTISINGQTQKVLRDESYLKNAILNPNLEIVQGFVANIMPSFKDQIPKKDLDVMLNYLGVQKTKQPAKINGAQLVQNNGCLGCHSLDGSNIVGPTFKGSFGTKRTVIREGKEFLIDANKAYFVRSILHPNKDIVKGYSNIMPSFEGIFNEEQTDAVVEYIKTIQ